MTSNNLYDLFEAVSSSMSEHELLLATQKGLIASEISMKRQELGMTQEDLARVTGVSQSLVSRWEKGETNFQLDTLCKIAVALNIKMQSPFGLRPRPKHFKSTGNIIPLFSWEGSYSAPHKYTDPEIYIAEEM